ncbi:hypothetical protein [Anditalea andensis]|uniref:Uncharacterized protein n=1 Tax=Anditalea andensis TaxID=1048983 RepID=A0A074LJH6_9BACT|nr:hypothetical protein [Anditalea andensis]KEO73957.1 hypothetical protein EL17_07330 [Anditalea andensis]
MAYNRQDAKEMCNATELELYDQSQPPKLFKLNQEDLKKNIKRSRDFRDKNRDLFRRQSIEMADTTGNKRGNSLIANQRTEMKAELMSEMLERFEQQLDNTSE